jgi:hypothetical protein
MKVLFVTPYLPSPPRFGGQRRMHGLMEELARRHEVSVLSFVNPNEDPTESVRVTREYCRHVVTVPNHDFGALVLSSRRTATSTASVKRQPCRRH